MATETGHKISYVKVRITVVILIAMMTVFFGLVCNFNQLQVSAFEECFIIQRPQMPAKKERIADLETALSAINRVKNAVNKSLSERKMTYSKANIILEAAYKQINNVLKTEQHKWSNPKCPDLHDTTHYAEDAWYEIRPKLGDKDNSPLTQETKDDLQSILNKLSGQLNCLTKELQCLKDKKVKDKTKCITN